MSGPDTLEDAVLFAKISGALSDETEATLLAELQQLRDDALRLVTIRAEAFVRAALRTPPIRFVVPHDPTRWGEPYGPTRETEMDAMLEHLAKLPTPPRVERPTINMIRGHAIEALLRGRFSDERSQAQIAAYLAARMPVCEERNAVALKRWNEHHRDAWQLNHLGTSRARTPTEGTN